MESIQRFIDVNMVVVYFTYGLVFFAAGLAIALQQLKLSSFRLARYLWLLATFFIVHSIADWGHVFIPIQSTYLSSDWIVILYQVQKVALAVSFAFLLLFAVKMMTPKLQLSNTGGQTLLWAALIWSALVTIGTTVASQGAEGETWIRYLLGFPAAMMAAAAFLTERRSFKVFPSSAAPIDITVTAAMLAVYAVLAGLIVPEQGTWPFSALSYQSVFDATGFPVQLYRILAGSVIVVFLIRTLSIFDLEIRHRLEVSERNQALFKDRQRIARDLHDGTIQTIYAAGLKLEAAADAAGSEPAETSASIRDVVSQLNAVISDTREYIFKLGSSRIEESDFYHYVKKVVDDFSASYPARVNLSFEGDHIKLSPEKVHNIILILHESLGNVAKHSKATSTEICFVSDAKALFCLVEDNGIGIDEERLGKAVQENRGRGLNNISERARAMGARLTVSRGASGRGTRVSLWVPFDQEQSGTS